MNRSTLRYSRTILAAIACSCAVGACNAGDGAGPDPLRPQHYQLRFINWSSLPFVVQQGMGGDHIELDSAALIPYAVGRTVDQRFLGDRTGRGSTGGNTRDTTVARGQFIDLRVLKVVSASGQQSLYLRDSAIVDVEMRDTVVIIRRAVNPLTARVDTGYFVNDMMVVPTAISAVIGQVYGMRPAVLAYGISRR